MFPIRHHTYQRFILRFILRFIKSIINVIYQIIFRKSRKPHKDGILWTLLIIPAKKVQ